MTTKNRITKSGESQEIGMQVYWIERKNLLGRWNPIKMFNAENDDEAIIIGQKLIAPPPKDIVVYEWEG